MKSQQELERTLQKIDGKGYPAYKDLKGVYDFHDFQLCIDHVQGDPFASPSHLRVRVPQALAGFAKDTYATKSREVALRDYLTRQFHGAARSIAKGNRGIGKSGLIEIDRPGQQVLERTAAFVTDKAVEVRFVMGLPAFGRRIAGRHANAMLCQELPQIVRVALRYEHLDKAALRSHIETAEDADALREQLETMGLVAFVADGAILPRASGIDPRPLEMGKAIPFVAPESLRVRLERPNAGPVSGMGIPKGITLIVGGGYHGKSTLLNALELGIYNHIPGDGRECAVTNPHAIKVRAEDGRRIEKVAISPFINNLPLGEDTEAFCSENASGSTSQAANIIESLEIGAQLLLIDEDTSATNFMIRDHRMQELVAKDKEPITPFIDKARQLYTDLGVSTILVIGGSGDYFDVADHVVCMIEYQPHDVTEQAHALARKHRAERTPEGGSTFGQLVKRAPLANSFDARRGKKDVHIKCPSTTTIAFGSSDIDLGALEQLVDISQTRAIAEGLYVARRYMNGSRPVREVIEALFQQIRELGLDVLSPFPAGHFAMPRPLEFAAALNRLRTLRVQQKP